jgi:hypothetical protein
MSIFKSRTFYTLVVMCLFNILNVYGHLLPAGMSDLVNLILTSIAAYFHVNPQQSYGNSVLPPTTPAA